MATKLDKLAFNLKFTSKSLARQSKKCEKEAKKLRKKVADALKKGNLDVARTYANAAIMQQNEANNLVKVSCQIEAVGMKVGMAARSAAISKSMGAVVKAMDSVLSASSADQMSRIMEKFAETSEDMEVRAAFMNDAMGSATATSTPADSVDGLLREVALDNDIELGAELAAPSGVALAAPAAAEATHADGTDAFAARLAALRGE
mmetsp:Transcript_10041/g.35167  ORF Transcript_10041/g.35167 Transcript_10041/m.35167 type:complete len:205 (-) Transcript_10041:76-690(-)|eukprot:CAMPEP_0203809724 /NCGR_PEP_ID=MMETSP0115-20131106/2483_1 /ASSEMBLY_ACC=CAM_ASM_000227 /TAXON_ID=33651 /ORGANISM="Bicosoecid sp, Strain ms1" /LENGTH=204 /DNA_ID=CAMNT_0050718479 /DNA_START=207 /DNA_END=821 /DNA_ORIENTATION=-